MASGRPGWPGVSENGPLGYPTTDEQVGLFGDGHYQLFQGGAIYWSPATGAHVVIGAIRDRWTALGAENGPLGYPVADQRAVPGGASQQFEHGTLTYNVAGATVR